VRSLFYVIADYPAAGGDDAGFMNFASSIATLSFTLMMRSVELGSISVRGPAGVDGERDLHAAAGIAIVVEIELVRAAAGSRVDVRPFANQQPRAMDRNMRRELTTTSAGSRSPIPDP
jgi:hypothetical protein